jgi:hypothetical protein
MEVAPDLLKAIIDPWKKINIRRWGNICLLKDLCLKSKSSECTQNQLQ